MRSNVDGSDLSELEQELELEMDDAEFESADDGELEYAGTESAELETDEELGGAADGGYAERLAELAQREFESEAELDGALTNILGEMEREFFFGKLVNKIRKSPLGRAGIGALKGFLKKKFKNIPGLSALGGLQAISKLARGDLRGALGNFAKAALPNVLAAVPGGAVALPALQALGFNRETADPDQQLEAWEGFVGAAREAYEYLAENLVPNADDPLAASQLAKAAFQHGVRGMTRGGERSGRDAGVTGGRVRTIRLRRGERLRIIAE